MIEWPDPSRPAEPTRQDKIARGEDCAVHPVVGCIVSHGNGTDQEQALNYLYSLRRATEQGIAGRAHDLSDEEYRAMCAKVVKWHETNSVQMPAPYTNMEFRRR